MEGSRGRTKGAGVIHTDDRVSAVKILVAWMLD
jgi:hypothetical protein